MPVPTDEYATRLAPAWVRAFSRRAIRPLKVRGPSLPRLNLPGAALDRAIKSSIDLIGELASTSTANALRAMKATGTKSLCGSQGRVLNSSGLVTSAAVVAK